MESHCRPFIGIYFWRSGLPAAFSNEDADAHIIIDAVAGSRALHIREGGGLLLVRLMMALMCTLTNLRFIAMARQ
jgi:hypothetical protein